MSTEPVAERHRGARRGGNLELYAWFAMRVSGVVLLFIAVFHLLYMHIVIGVENIDFQVIVERWQNPAWRLFDLILLVFALTHGTNGLRTVINDYLPHGMANAVAKGVAYTALVVFFLMGAHVIFTLDASAVATIGAGQ
jgi:succinate dehydrogenase / fumarate reductase membrane anchor subunit